MALDLASQDRVKWIMKTQDLREEGSTIARLFWTLDSVGQGYHSIPLESWSNPFYVLVRRQFFSRGE